MSTYSNHSQHSQHSQHSHYKLEPIHTPPPPMMQAPHYAPQPSAPVDSQDWENGRRYHRYRAGAYMYPNDDQEQDRLDIYHKIFLVARGGKELHRAPIKQDIPPRILDLGTGTGIWAIEMADKYPGAEVIGMDLSSIQPMWIPETLRFLIADFESEWTLGKDTFDLIHLRIGTGSISSYPALFKRVYQHLRPGCGWFEYVDIDMVATSDDGTLTPQHAVSQWQELLMEASSRTGKPLRFDHNAVLSQLHNCGFTDIQSHVIKLPLNPWPASHSAKELGRWYNLGMSEGLEALTLGPLCRVEGWSKTRVHELLTRVQKELSSKSIHGYHKLHIYIARRPDGHPSHR